MADHVAGGFRAPLDALAAAGWTVRERRADAALAAAVCDPDGNGPAAFLVG